MAAGQPRPPPSSVRMERLLRAACAAMAAAGALLLGFSAQTKTVLFVQKKAVPKDVQALWVLIVAAAAAAAYHAAQLARCLCMDRLASSAGCRRLGRAAAFASFLLDKVRSMCRRDARFCSWLSIPALCPNRFHLNPSLSPSHSGQLLARSDVQILGSLGKQGKFACVPAALHVPVVCSTSSRRRDQTYRSRVYSSLRHSLVQLQLHLV
ncbi:CASP-like protein 2C2 isoform X1 [Miscanthus floridulus]|uniref:CASP-like protein 2C2 isoform X1 n=1 Tax=Miscanthus floridulus TaxID=154761 RepID=UPI00345A96C9